MDKDTSITHNNTPRKNPPIPVKRSIHTICLHILHNINVNTEYMDKKLKYLLAEHLNPYLNKIKGSIHKLVTDTLTIVPHKIPTNPIFIPKNIEIIKLSIASTKALYLSYQNNP